MNNKAEQGSGIHRICAGFVEYATKHPEKIAVVEADRKIKYGEFLALGRSLAHALQESVTQPEQVVAILGQRNFETVLAMVSSLLAGIPFVVIDSAYPKDRIASIWKLSGAVGLLHTAANPLVHDASFLEKMDCNLWIAVDGKYPEKFANPIPYESAVAYLLFTSGTTGFPKGIRTGHQPLPHFIQWYQDEFEPKPGSRFSMFAGLGHDPIFRDVFIPLSIGGELHIPAQTDLLNPERLFDWMQFSKIQYAHMTPQLIGLLASRRGQKSTLADLRYVFSGGDVLRPATRKEVEGLAPSARLVNFYGTSETPQAMAYQVIGAELAAPYPLGIPISDVRIHILDENTRQVKNGELGEIAIETEYLSLGYIDDPKQSAHTDKQRKYLPSMSDDMPGARVYLTGDTGSKDEHGRVYFNGRKDDQVKIRGYRVSCTEVAATLERYPAIGRSVVLPEESPDGDAFLVAYITGDKTQAVQTMPGILPAYMVPSVVVHIDAIPLLPNGKLDRGALRKLNQNYGSKFSREMDAELYKDIAKILHVSHFDTNLSYMELGGDSLSFIKVSLLVEDLLGFLPDNWEQLPLKKIVEMSLAEESVDKATENYGFLTKIKTALIFRAMSIFFVVLTHAGLNAPVGTSTLFVVAGMSYAQFLLPGLIATGRLLPTWKFIGKYALPAALWQLMRAFTTKSFWLPDVLLMGTFWQDPAAGHYTLWFLDVLTASILIFASIAWVFNNLDYLKPLQKSRYGGSYWLSIFAFSIGILGFFLQVETIYWDGDLGSTSVGPFRWFWILPLGAAIQLARTRSEKMLLTIATVAMGMLFYGEWLSSWRVDGILGSFFFVSVMVLIWFDQIPIPQPIRKPILLLASNSLFIYIVNYSVMYQLMPKLGMPDWLLLRVTMAIGIGILCSYLWERFIQLLCQFPRTVKSVKSNFYSSS